MASERLELNNSLSNPADQARLLATTSPHSGDGSTPFRCQAAAYVWTIVLSTLPLVFGWAPTSVILTSVHVERR